MSQGAIVNPNRAIPRFRLNNVTPFTYRDGLTFLEIIEELREWATETLPEIIDGENEKLVDAFEGIRDDLIQLVEEQGNELADATDEWNTRFDQILNNFTAYIESLNEQAVANLVSTSGTLVRKAILDLLPYVLTSWFGSVGDGVSDDTDSIQAALASGHPNVILPPSKHLVSGELVMNSKGQRFSSDGGTLVNETEGNHCVILVQGAYDLSKTVVPTAPFGKGDTVISVPAHNIVVGDVVRLISQRVATSPEAGNYRMGFATQSTAGPRFSEVHRVEAVSSRTITLEGSGVLFPDYLTDGGSESAQGSGFNSEIRVLNGSADDVVVDGIAIETVSSGAVRVYRARNVMVRGVHVVRSTPGRAFELEDVYLTDVNGCSATVNQWQHPHDPSDPVELDHAAINVFHVTSSQESGFTKCKAVRGTQPFDITYNQRSPFTSVYCYVRDCESVGSLYNPLTIHPGVFRSIVERNRFVDCVRNGISVRGLENRVTDNVIHSNVRMDVGAEGNLGIYLHEGAGRRSVISDNEIRGFAVGMGIQDGTGKTYESTSVDVVFRDNSIFDYTIGYMYSPMYGATIPEHTQNISVIGNYFQPERDSTITILPARAGRGSNGLYVVGNHVSAKNDALYRGYFLVAHHNTKNVYVKSNTIDRIGYLYRDSNPQGVQGVHDPSAGVDSVYWLENDYNEVVNTVLAASTPTRIVVNRGSAHPFPPEYHLDNFLGDSHRYPLTTEAITVENGFPADIGPCTFKSWKLGTRVFQEVEGWFAPFKKYRRNGVGTLSGWVEVV